MKKASVIIMKNQMGGTLFLNRCYPPFGYGLPGGKVDKDETPKEAIIREVKEETGLTILNKDVFLYNKVKTDKYEIYVYMWNKRLASTVDIVLSKEHSSYMYKGEPYDIDLAGNTEELITESEGMSYQDECRLLYFPNTPLSSLQDTIQGLSLERNMLIQNTCTQDDLDRIDFHIKYVETLINEKPKEPLHN